VLYNFYQATSLTINSISIEESVLAPYANIDFAGGDINGTMIGNEINGSGKSHNYLFDGNLPNAVPEPSSVVMMLTAGALGVIPLARRRLRRPTA